MECNIPSPSQESLSEHLASQNDNNEGTGTSVTSRHEQDERPYLCSKEGCQKKFKTKGHRDTHVVQIHLKAKERPYPCFEEGCRKKFKTSSQRDAHAIQVHLKDRPCICSEEGCRKRFKTRGHLDAHVAQVHLKVKSFSCPEEGCNKEFKTKGHLHTHVKVHLKRSSSPSQESLSGPIASQNDNNEGIETSASVTSRQEQDEKKIRRKKKKKKVPLTPSEVLEEDEVPGSVSKASTSGEKASKAELPKSDH